MVTRKISFALCLLLSIGMLAQISFGYVFIETNVFGPKTYVRGTGGPQTFIDTFSVINPNGEFRIHVKNGEWDGDKRIEDAVSSARIFINGVEIIGTNDFSKNVASIDDSIQEMLSENIIEVWMASAPGSKLVVEIIGSDQDDVLPVISITDPLNDSKTNNAEPLLKAVYFDDWMGIDASSFSGMLDGVDITSLFVIGYENSYYQINAGDALSEGNHQFTATISDELGNTATTSSTFMVDLTPPVIAINTPPDGSIISENTPLIQLSYSDNLAGVDLSSLSVLFDGNDITSLFTVGAASSSYQIESGDALYEGNHQLIFTLADKVGNLTTTMSAFTIDLTPPTLSIEYPPDGQTIQENAPLVSISYSDDVSGVDLSTLFIEFNGSDFTSNFSISDAAASYQAVSGDFSDGVNEIVVTLRDVAGNESTVSSNFTIEQFRAIASAYPIEGYAPLTVLFNQAGVDPSSSIENYRWDFDGNGSWDTYDQVARQYHHTYSYSGIYNAILRVMNNNGEYALDTVVITTTPTPPTATASSVPSNGELPLAVGFYGSGTDPDGYLILYEWDFNGDGTYDWSSTSTGNTAYTYVSSGTYSAVFRVTDNAGLTAMAPVILTEVRVGPSGSPTASLGINPTTGQAPLAVSLTGVGTDPEGIITLYEWDFDGDGVFDWSSTSTGNTTYAYDIPGVYYPAFRVTDGDGLSAIDYGSITIGLGVNLSIPDDTYNPYAGETSIIRTTITASIPVNIVIKTKGGDLIRTLVSNETRTAGTHSDSWDGTNDLGQMVPDGPYYAVMEYFLDGQWIAYDLTNSTGGQRFLPSRQSTGGNSSNPRTISPFEDEFLDVHFSTPRAAEITCFVGYLWNVDQRIRTVIDRTPYPAGSHILWWDGLDDVGSIAEAPPGYYMILGFWGYYLADNAMFLTGGAPVLSDVSASPNGSNAWDESCGGSGPSFALSYSLSDEAAVTMKVIDVQTGTVVRSLTEHSVSAGQNVIVWDGLDQQGNSAGGGNYQLGVSATDADGNISVFRYTLIWIES